MMHCRGGGERAGGSSVTRSCKALFVNIAIGEQPNGFPGLSLNAMKVLLLASYCSRIMLMRWNCPCIACSRFVAEENFFGRLLHFPKSSNEKCFMHPHYLSVLGGKLP